MKHSEETKRKISETLKRKGIKPSVLPSAEQCRKNLGNKIMKKGDTPWNKGSHGVQTAWNKGIEYNAIKGDKNHNWKGGVVTGNRKIRNSAVYRNWRKSVFERDDYTCQACGIRGGELHVDHILPFSLFPQYRTEIGNGQTLCADCHKTTYSYNNPQMNKLNQTY